MNRDCEVYSREWQGGDFLRRRPVFDNATYLALSDSSLRFGTGESALSKSKHSNDKHYESAGQQSPHQIYRPSRPTIFCSVSQVVFGNRLRKIERHIMFTNIP